MHKTAKATEQLAIGDWVAGLAAISEREFTLEIAAKGFETWVYRRSSAGSSSGDAPATPLNLQAGENLSLDIALMPVRLPEYPRQGGW